MIKGFGKTSLLLSLLLSQASVVRAGVVGAVGNVDKNQISSLSFAQILSVVVNLILAFAGIAFFFLLFVGGFRYLNSGGDPKSAAAARATLTNAFIGLIIIVASFLIAQLLFSLFGVKGVVFK